MTSIIGIISCGYHNGRQFVTDTYIKAVEAAGGTAVLIPCAKESSFSVYTDLCDGFLFCGGDDVSPLLFGEDLLTAQGRTNWDTNWFHLSFMRHVLETKLPVFGICRGMQILNLALGGTICQDLSLRDASSLQHMQISDSRSDPCHKIIISKNSILYNILGEHQIVNSFHHQCVRQLGQNLKPTAVASDGIIEAIESASHSFAAGVQWHPECMYQRNNKMGKLFQYFVHQSESAKNLTLI